MPRHGLRKTVVTISMLIGVSLTFDLSARTPRPPSKPPPHWPGMQELVEIQEPWLKCRVWIPKQGSGDSVTWDGTCKSDVAHGRGTLFVQRSPSTWDRYDGELRDGKMHGHGVFEWSSGTRYNGQFVDGQLTGSAVLSWRPGASFTGLFENGLPEGQGILQMPTTGEGALRTEASYKEGEFHRGVLNGRGFVVRPGYLYEGEFVDDRPHGRGIEVRENTYRYEGGFTQGRFSGSGLLVKINVGRYHGEFRDGEPSGYGVQIEIDGTRYEGDFSHGVRHGRGALVMIDGGRYEGDFREGRIDGTGVYVAPSGAKYAGAWKDGCYRQGGRSAFVGTKRAFCETE